MDIGCVKKNPISVQYASLPYVHLLCWSFLSVSTQYAQYLNKKQQLEKQLTSCKQCACFHVGWVNKETLRCDASHNVKWWTSEHCDGSITLLSHCIPLGAAGRYSSVNPRSMLLPILHSHCGGWECKRGGRETRHTEREIDQSPPALHIIRVEPQPRWPSLPQDTTVHPALHKIP